MTCLQYELLSLCVECTLLTDSHVSFMYTAEGADGLCSDRLWQNSGICSSVAALSSGASRWWCPCCDTHSNQRARWTSMHLNVTASLYKH